MFLPCSLLLQRDLFCPESPVLIKHLEFLHTIAKMLEYLSNITIGKDKNAVVSNSQNWREIKRLLKKCL